MQEESETSISKSDRTDRAQDNPEYQAKVLAAFEQNGVSTAAFARPCRVKYQFKIAHSAFYSRRAGC